MSEMEIKSKVNVRDYNIIWEVQNYSCLHKEKGEYLTSPAFMTGKDSGEWTLELYPEGDKRASDGYISIFICNTANLNYSARFELSILKKTKEKMFVVKDVDKDFSEGWGYANFVKKHDLFDEKQDLLDDDTLTINLQLKVVEGISDLTCVKPEVVFDLDSISRDYLNFLNTSVMSDFEVIVKERRYKVHKVVLAARSPVFAAMFSNDFLENNINVLDIQDVDPDVMEIVIHYIYSGKCHQLLEKVQEILPLSDKYGLDHLKTQCDIVLSSQLTRGNVIPFLKLADMYNLEKLKKNSINLILDEGNKIRQTSEWVQFVSNNNKLAIEVLSAVTISL